MRFIKQNCNPEDANDKTLPVTAFLVTYIDNDVTFYDLVMPEKRVEAFDYYWDRYREGLISIKQAEGRVNPKIWEPPKKK